MVEASRANSGPVSGTQATSPGNPTRPPAFAGRARLLAALIGILLTTAALGLLATNQVPSPTNPSSNTTIVVTIADMDGWAFQTSGTASAGFAPGPGTPPLGVGSLHMAVGADGDSGAQLRNADFAGTALGDVTTLAYDTYVSAFMGCQAPYLIVNVDNDEDGASDDLLFFEPCYQSGAYSGDPVPNQCGGNPACVSLNTWQTWDALVGGWWSLNAGTFGPPLVTFASYVAANPDATIVSSGSGLGGIRIVAGFGAGAWDDFVGAADGFAIGLGSDATTYDFEPSLEPCAFAADPAALKITLLADCTTDHTLFIPDGWTLDGARFTITGVDPAGGHFLGAIVMNGGSVAHIRNTLVRATGLADVCDPSGPADTRLRGILFNGAGGSILHNTVTDIHQGASGCQEGNGIEVRNPPFDGSHPATKFVEIAHNTVLAYQKTGVLTNGDVAVHVHHNRIGASATQANLAANSIQVGFGAVATVEHNLVEGNQWLGASDFSATAILVFDAGPAVVRWNNIGGNADIGIAVFLGTAVAVDNNRVFDDGADGPHGDFGIVDVLGTDNAFTNNKVRGFDDPFFGFDPGTNKVIP